MSLHFWITLDSGLGGMARFAPSGLVAHPFGETVSWGPVLINVLGSFAISFFATFTEPGRRVFVGATGHQFLLTGVFGVFTPLSSFSLQPLSLARDGEWLSARANATGQHPPLSRRGLVSPRARPHAQRWTLDHEGVCVLHYRHGRNTPSALR